MFVERIRRWVSRRKLCLVCVSAIAAAHHGRMEEDLISIEEPEKEMMGLRVEA